MLPDKLFTDSIACRSYALPPAFDCSWARGGADAAWVQVTGELDIATTTRLERALDEAMLWARTVVLDLRELAFMAGCGVQAILVADRHARQEQRRLVVVRGSPQVDRVFAVTGNSVELHDLAAGRPPGQMLPTLAEPDQPA